MRYFNREYDAYSGTWIVLAVVLVVASAEGEIEARPMSDCILVLMRSQAVVLSTEGGEQIMFGALAGILSWARFRLEGVVFMGWEESDEEAKWRSTAARCLQ